MTETSGAGDVDAATVASFGHEWARFAQADLASPATRQMFDAGVVGERT